MKNRGLLIVLLVVILLVVIGATILVNSYRERLVKADESYVSPISSDVQLVEEHNNVSHKLANANIACSSENSDMIPIENVEFDINLDKNVSKEYIENVFFVENATTGLNIDFEITKITEKHYKITIPERLSQGEIYNVVEKTSEGSNRWAFQTEKKLDVSYVYPKDGKSVYSTSRIEVYFNFSPVDNVENYVSIDPPIDGYWEKYKYSNGYYFTHNEEFSLGTKYNLIIKKGMHDAYDNEMTSEYTYSFSIKAPGYNAETNEDIVIIQSENAIKTGEKFSMDIATLVHFNSKDSIFDISKNEYRIYEIQGKGEFIKLLKGIKEDDKYAEKYWNSSDTVPMVSGRIYDANVIRNGENGGDSKIEKTIQTNFSKNTEGYFVALAKVNELYDIRPFQINNTIVSSNFLNTKEAFFVIKNAPNAQIYINDEMLGKPDSDGVLYVEDVTEDCKKIKEGFNYLEIKSDNESLIFDITTDLSDFTYKAEFDEYYEEYSSTRDSETNIITRFNNGYLYHDRPVYKVGEDINFWGYARNRVYGVKEAKIVITVGENTIVNEKLKLNQMGCFTYKYNLSEVNPDSNLCAKLYINDKCMDSRYIRIEDYSTRKYVIDIQRDGTEFVAGSSSVINVSANTYDGIPLSETEFKIKESDNYSKNVISISSQNIKTDLEGNGSGKISFNLTGMPTQVYGESHGIRVENSLLDGGYEYLHYYVYPYKNTASLEYDYDKKNGEYKLNVKEHDVLKGTIPANDKVVIIATACYVERVVDKVVYDEYTKEEKNIYKTVTHYKPEYNKKIELDPIDGKAEYVLKNWSDGTNEKGYYSFNAYLEADIGYSLYFANNYGSAYLVYGYDMWNENKKVTNNASEPGQIIVSGENVTEEIVAKDQRTKSNTIPMYYDYINEEKVLDFGEDLIVELYDGYKINEYDTARQKLDDYSNIEIYTLLISGKGAEIIKTKNKQLKIKYEIAHGANISLLNVIYDGEKAYATKYRTSYNVMEAADLTRDAMDSVLKLKRSTNDEIDYEKTKLDFTVEFDKEQYKPGDVATIKIKTNRKEEGVASGVNISGVDTGYLDENGSVYRYLNRTVRNSYAFAANSISSHAYNYIDYTIFQGGAGGGDGDADRNKILTTAMFENVVTDKNGEATIKVQLPDNITEWTLTCQAISEDYFTGDLVKTLVVTKDFYVDVSNKEKYLEDEKFSFNVKALGKEYFGKTAKGKVQILDEKDTVLEEDTVDLIVGKVSSYKVKNGLKAGNYKIRLEGAYDEHKDAIVKTFSVKETLFETSYREKLDINKGDEIEVLGSQGELYAVNSDVSKVIKELYNLINLKYQKGRHDCEIISDAAQDVLTSLTNGKKINIKKKSYSVHNVLTTMDTSSDDIELALRNIATGKVDFDPYLFERVATQKGVEAGLWARAAIGESVLKQLRSKKEDIINNGNGDYTKEQTLYVALGLAEIGDFENALDLYELIKPSISKDNDSYEYTLLGILTIKLNMDNREEMYNFFISNYKDLPEYANYFKLYYIVNELNKNFEKGKVTIAINGIRKEIAVNNVGFTKLYVNNKSKYKLIEKTDNVDLWLSDYKEIDVSQYEQKGYVKKTYSKNNPKVGETVTVTLTIDKMKFHENIGDGTYSLMDIVPNNMTFIETLENSSQGSGYYSKKDGQKVEFNFYIYYDPQYNNKNDIVIKYDARVTNDGDQVETGLVVKNNKDDIVDWIK